MQLELAIPAAPAVRGAPCPDCEAAKRHMKTEGFRNWRDHACYEHAAVDLDAYLAERQPSQDRKA